MGELLSKLDALLTNVDTQAPDQEPQFEQFLRNVVASKRKSNMPPFVMPSAENPALDYGASTPTVIDAAAALSADKGASTAEFRRALQEQNKPLGRQDITRHILDMYIADKNPEILQNKSIADKTPAERAELLEYNKLIAKKLLGKSKLPKISARPLAEEYGYFDPDSGEIVLDEANLENFAILPHELTHADETAAGISSGASESGVDTNLSAADSLAKTVRSINNGHLQTRVAGKGPITGETAALYNAITKQQGSK